MDLTQGLTLLLSSVWRCTMSRCLKKHELKDVAEKRLHYPQLMDVSPEAAAAADSEFSCPVQLYNQQPVELSDRSVSPWRYVRKTMKDHFPHEYAEAQCLCSGCILIQGQNPPQESHDYNSVPVLQSRGFLKRELCSGGEKYHLKLVTVQVAVGCTCARAKSS
ncbi:interleukin-17C [Platichthys flesus]|uniref:interleukin-17C n=1 Tax=Platichthys flesus TaxID=8260 RepID=UPI002DBB9675|nr:interleukin-17C [Platichthys flesus]